MSNIAYITTTCPRCETSTLVEVSREGYQQWVEGALIQEAFPVLSVEDRERLMTGICPSCWKAMFATKEDE